MLKMLKLSGMIRNLSLSILMLQLSYILVKITPVISAVVSVLLGK